jgi:putative transposase
MMSTKRTKHSAKFKKKMALEALKGDKTISDIASRNNLHPTQITKWKKQFEEGMEDIFTNIKKSKRKNNDGIKEAELFEEIGRLKFELDWLKKKAALFD